MWSASTQALSDGWEVTDDASLLEQHGVPVHLVEGDPSNFKVTLPSDWDLFCHLT
jgi:2-C-methyl-D-erythritol 4-phosphate cytidylyltransferase